MSTACRATSQPGCPGHGSAGAHVQGQSWWTCSAAFHRGAAVQHGWPLSPLLALCSYPSCSGLHLVVKAIGSCVCALWGLAAAPRRVKPEGTLLPAGGPAIVWGEQGPLWLTPTLLTHAGAARACRAAWGVPVAGCWCLHPRQSVLMMQVQAERALLPPHVCVPPVPRPGRGPPAGPSRSQPHGLHEVWAPAGPSRCVRVDCCTLAWGCASAWLC